MQARKFQSAKAISQLLPSETAFNFSYCSCLMSTTVKVKFYGFFDFGKVNIGHRVARSKLSVCAILHYLTIAKIIFNKYFKAAQWKLVKIVTWYIIECEMRKERERNFFCLEPRRVKVKIEIFHFSFSLMSLFYYVETVDVKLSMGYYGVTRR